LNHKRRATINRGPACLKLPPNRTLHGNHKATRMTQSRHGGATTQRKDVHSALATRAGFLVERASKQIGEADVVRLRRRFSSLMARLNATGIRSLS
jgi:hypothetical protein